MKGNRRFSLIDRFAMGKSRSLSSRQDASRAEPAANIDRGQGALSATVTGLKGPALEQAYRELMLQNQLLAESNEHLHERLARMEAGLEESPAAKQLIRAQRNALAERSHRLREVQYENLNLKREQKKLVKENQKLTAGLARHMQDIQPLRNKEQLSRCQLEEATAALRHKSDQLAKLTDKYYQLEARSKPRPPTSSAVNGRF
jgi:chromosome segregation ATPase